MEKSPSHDPLHFETTTHDGQPQCLHKEYHHRSHPPVETHYICRCHRTCSMPIFGSCLMTSHSVHFSIQSELTIFTKDLWCHYTLPCLIDQPLSGIPWCVRLTGWACTRMLRRDRLLPIVPCISSLVYMTTSQCMSTRDDITPWNFMTLRNYDVFMTQFCDVYIWLDNPPLWDRPITSHHFLHFLFQVTLGQSVSMKDDITSLNCAIIMTSQCLADLSLCAVPWCLKLSG